MCSVDDEATSHVAVVTTTTTTTTVGDCFREDIAVKRRHVTQRGDLRQWPAVRRCVAAPLPPTTLPTYVERREAATRYCYHSAVDDAPLTPSQLVIDVLECFAPSCPVCVSLSSDYWSAASLSPARPLCTTVSETETTLLMTSSFSHLYTLRIIAAWRQVGR